MNQEAPQYPKRTITASVTSDCDFKRLSKPYFCHYWDGNKNLHKSYTNIKSLSQKILGEGLGEARSGVTLLIQNHVHYPHSIRDGDAAIIVHISLQLAEIDVGCDHI